MKTITFNNKKYICPEKWDEVTLKMQMKVSEDTDKISIEELKKFAILSGYCGIPIDELKKAKLTDLTDLFKAISFINQPLQEKPIIEFDFNGKHYYCGQNLIDMEFQDFISIENTLHDNSGHTYTSLPTILAIMCKQKKKIYKNKYSGEILHIIPITIEKKKDVEETDGILETIDDYDVLQRAKEFEDLPLPIAHNLSLFFSASVRLYSNLFQLYSKPETLKEAMEKQVESVESTLKKLDGKGLLTKCVAGILRIYLKSIRKKLDRHFTSIQ